MGYNGCEQDAHLPVTKSANVWASHWNSSWDLLILAFDFLKIVLEPIVEMWIVIITILILLLSCIKK